MNPLEKRLVQRLAGFTIIDAHEHLGPEAERVSRPVSVFTLFSHYTQTDLKAAGMSEEEYRFIQDEEKPLPARWRTFRPYFERIRWTGYARPASIVAREFYGIDDINDDTYETLSELLARDNTPGLYERILRERCHIELCLTQCGRYGLPEDVLVPLLPLPVDRFLKRGDVEKASTELNMEVSNLETYVLLAEALLDRWRSRGVVGLKITCRATTNPSHEEASRAFTSLWESGEVAAGSPVLRDYLFHRLLESAADLNLPVAVHTGIIWNNWSDFTATHPQHLIPLLQQHWRTRFDCYHAGIPWVGTVGVMGKTFPNLWLNLCWCHVISPEMTVRALNEWVDLVPANKIIAFGGDYAVPVEKVYGHLVMARENIARVLGQRIERGLMDEDQALELAHTWFYENPVALYRLDERGLTSPDGAFRRSP
jgi:predicted TIM-barrel fold metal-dependent hydrolase